MLVWHSALTPDAGCFDYHGELSEACVDEEPTPSIRLEGIAIGYEQYRNWKSISDRFSYRSKEPSGNNLDRFADAMTRDEMDQGMHVTHHAQYLPI